MEAAIIKITVSRVKRTGLIRAPIKRYIHQYQTDITKETNRFYMLTEYTPAFKKLPGINSDSMNI